MIGQFHRNVQNIRPEAAFGFILNLPSGSRLTGWLPLSIFSRKHWIAIRKIGDELYFNLDSHLTEPSVIGDVSFSISPNRYLSIESPSDLAIVEFNCRHIMLSSILVSYQQTVIPRNLQLTHCPRYLRIAK